MGRDDNKERLDTVMSNLEVAVEQLLEQLRTANGQDEVRAKIRSWGAHWFGEIFDAARMRLRDMETSIELQSRLIERLKRANEELKRRSGKR